MIEAEAKNLALARVASLVSNFRRNEDDFRRTTYNETQVRTDFITPLLEAFGWDVYNRSGQPLALREVIEEATVEVGEERLSKRPDYELRLARQRKLFLEAKRPSVRIENDRSPAFQIRRYGYSASLPISVLTNFHQLAVYDCRPAPAVTDEAHVARILFVRYDEFETRFDELWPLLSRYSVYSGAFDARFAVSATRHGTDQFDEYFLRQVSSWRKRLFIDIHTNMPGLSPPELTYCVQLFLSRIIFLRICEDREIERYENLKSLPAENTFDALMVELRRADEFYDSGLFRLLDDAPLGIRISDGVLREIITELYYPQSPYTFAVVETEVLGEIYELFLGEVIAVEGTSIQIVSKPEIREAGGVYPTPRYIVDAIVERTLAPALAGKSPVELTGFTVADPCCGSGIFLLSVYEFFLEHYLNWYLANDRAQNVGRRIYEVAAGQWHLTFDEKKRILLEHVRGVDIDPEAVEVARFSLLLKLIEDETADRLRDYVAHSRTRALPSIDHLIRCGNSLVSSSEWSAVHGVMPAELVERVNPFSWQTEFVTEMTEGGFNIIVANPPYIRIQNMTNYSPEEVAFYKSSSSPYSTAQQDNFDKYALFIERSLSLLRADGRLGVIIPNKFMTTQAGGTLRRLLTSERLIEEIVHFGAQQVFGRRAANYTCILVLDRRGCDSVRIEQVGRLEEWRYGNPGSITEDSSDTITEDRWRFADREAHALFQRIQNNFPARLGQLAEIFVGVQTSADDIYIFRPTGGAEDTLTLRWNGRDWPIEKEILRPCLHDASLFPFIRPQPNAWMIFPYEMVAGRTRTGARLIQPVEMERNFPRCYEYLQARRVELEKRSITGGTTADHQFYQFGRSQSLTKFNTPKIILPILSTEPRYTYDDSNIMVTGGGNGPYYMIRPHEDGSRFIYYLMAVLNHPLSEAFVRTNTSLFRGGYYSHGKQFIKDLPIPIPTEEQCTQIENMVCNLISDLDAVTSARTPHLRIVLERRAAHLRMQIETRITALFELSVADMDLVRAVPIPT